MSSYKYKFGDDFYWSILPMLFLLFLITILALELKTLPFSFIIICFLFYSLGGFKSIIIKFDNDAIHVIRLSNIFKLKKMKNEIDYKDVSKVYCNTNTTIFNRVKGIRIKLYDNKELIYSPGYLNYSVKVHNFILTKVNIDKFDIKSLNQIGILFDGNKFIQDKNKIT